MSQTAIIGVAVLMMVCSSASVGAFFLIPSKPTLGPTPGPSPGPSPGTVCTPVGTPDTNATYKYGANNACVMTCKTGYVKEDGTCVEEEKEEVFYVGGYDYTKVQAAATCTTHGAVVATGAQLAAAQVAEADWCATGWLSDQTVAKYPINTSIMAGCGNGTPGIKAWTPPNGMAGVNCYGVKPDEGTEKVSRFNTAKWSRHD